MLQCAYRNNNSMKDNDMKLRSPTTTSPASLSTPSLTSSIFHEAKCWVQGEILPLQTLGAVKTLFIRSEADDSYPEEHVLSLQGDSKAFAALWGPLTPTRWVSCEQEASAGQAAQERIIGLHIEGNTVDLVVLFNPFLPAAREALASWGALGTVELMVIPGKFQRHHTVPVKAPFLTQDRINLPITLTEADSQDHVVCMSTLQAQLPKLLDSSRTVFAYTAPEELNAMMAAMPDTTKPAQRLGKKHKHRGQHSWLM
jgi:hypothetical protein